MGYTIADDGVVEVCGVCDSVTYDTDSTPWRPVGCECDFEDGGEVMREHAARLSREVGANRVGGEVCGRDDCNYPIADCGHVAGTVITDAGRAEAGYSEERPMGGPVRDCVIRAIAILERPRSEGETQGDRYASVVLTADAIGGPYAPVIGFSDADADYMFDIHGFRPVDPASVRTGILRSHSLGHAIALIDGVPHDDRPVTDVAAYEEGWVRL